MGKESFFEKRRTTLGQEENTEGKKRSGNRKKKEVKVQDARTSRKK